jgi:hypothetical protein
MMTRLQAMHLEIGNVIMWLGNGCDPDAAAEELELILEKYPAEPSENTSSVEPK